MQRLPPWIRTPRKTDAEYASVQKLLSGCGLNTVCTSASCPNRNECWNRGTATFMILGNICTRNCLFCGVKSGTPQSLEEDEPARVATAAREMGLKYVVVTSVTRDDLDDGGADHFARVIGALRHAIPNVGVEVLTPDFRGNAAHVERVLAACPDVFAHNLETVERLQRRVRPQAKYGRSLKVLQLAAHHNAADIVVKTGLMLGLGESEQEVLQAMQDAFDAGCRLLTLGQYLAPGKNHYPVDRFVHPDEFAQYAKKARAMGYAGVASAPLVRSSYRAAEFLAQARKGRGE